MIYVSCYAIRACVRRGSATFWRSEGAQQFAQGESAKSLSRLLKAQKECSNKNDREAGSAGDSTVISYCVLTGLRQRVDCQVSFAERREASTKLPGVVPCTKKAPPRPQVCDPTNRLTRCV